MIKWLASLWNAFPISLQHQLIYIFGPKYIVGTNIILTDEAGRIWLQRHRFWGSKPWGLPGGHLDHNETPQQAIVREIKEELSAEVIIHSIMDIQLYHARGLVVYFIGRLSSPIGQIDATEVIEADYYDLSQLPTDIQPHHRQIIEQYIRQQETQNDG